MSEMIKVAAPGVHAQIAPEPVSRQAFETYLRATGKSIPLALTRMGRPTEPVTEVSQVAAQAYCQWLSKQAGQPYRLPAIAELVELFSETTAEGISTGIWPHHYASRPELRGGMKPVYLCEWTNETESMPGQHSSTGHTVLGCIFYPPWLRHGSNAVQVHAYLASTDGFSFVTFRLARNL